MKCTPLPQPIKQMKCSAPQPLRHLWINDKLPKANIPIECRDKDGDICIGKGSGDEFSPLFKPDLLNDNYLIFWRYAQDLYK